MTIRIGLIGLGGIMNGKHIPDYLNCTGHELTAVCDINPEALQKCGDRLNIPAEHRFLKYEDLMDSGLVDAVDIATPDYLHCRIADAAIAHGLHFCVEKPMGMTYREVHRTVKAAGEKGLIGGVCFSWHYRAGVRALRELVRSGEIGELYHVYIRTIKDSGLWEGRRLEWRFDGNKSASGVMGDLCSHMFDIARFVGGVEIDSLVADAGIFVKERPSLDGTQVLPVTTWDWCNILAKLEGGANATFQISRTTKNVPDSTVVELYGTKGKAIFEFGYGNDVRRLAVQTDGELRELPIREMTDANQSEAFIHLLTGETDGLEADLHDGERCQAALDAAFRSVAEKRWVSPDEIIREAE